MVDRLISGPTRPGTDVARFRATGESRPRSPSGAISGPVRPGIDEEIFRQTGKSVRIGSAEALRIQSQQQKQASQLKQVTARTRTDLVAKARDIFRSLPRDASRQERLDASKTFRDAVAGASVLASQIVSGQKTQITKELKKISLVTKTKFSEAEKARQKFLSLSKDAPSDVRRLAAKQFRESIKGLSKFDRDKIIKETKVSAPRKFISAKVEGEFIPSQAVLKPTTLRQKDFVQSVKEFLNLGDLSFKGKEILENVVNTPSLLIPKETPVQLITEEPKIIGGTLIKRKPTIQDVDKGLLPPQQELNIKINDILLRFSTGSINESQADRELKTSQRDFIRKETTRTLPADVAISIAIGAASVLAPPIGLTLGGLFGAKAFIDRKKILNFAKENPKTFSKVLAANIIGGLAGGGVAGISKAGSIRLKSPTIKFGGKGKITFTQQQLKNLDTGFERNLKSGRITNTREIEVKVPNPEGKDVTLKILQFEKDGKIGFFGQEIVDGVPTKNIRGAGRVTDSQAITNIITNRIKLGFRGKVKGVEVKQFLEQINSKIIGKRKAVKASFLTEVETRLASKLGAKGLKAEGFRELVRKQLGDKAFKGKSKKPFTADEFSKAERLSKLQLTSQVKIIKARQTKTVALFEKVDGKIFKDVTTLTKKVAPGKFKVKKTIQLAKEKPFKGDGTFEVKIPELILAKGKKTVFKTVEVGAGFIKKLPKIAKEKPTFVRISGKKIKLLPGQELKRAATIDRIKNGKPVRVRTLIVRQKGKITGGQRIKIETPIRVPKGSKVVSISRPDGLRVLRVVKKQQKPSTVLKSIVKDATKKQGQNILKIKKAGLGVAQELGKSTQAKLLRVFKTKNIVSQSAKASVLTSLTSTQATNIKKARLQEIAKIKKELNLQKLSTLSITQNLNDTSLLGLQSILRSLKLKSIRLQLRVSRTGRTSFPRVPTIPKVIPTLLFPKEDKSRTFKALSKISKKGGRVQILVGLQKKKRKPVGKPLPPFKALRKAQQFVDRNIQASFVLKPVKGKAKVKDIRPIKVNRKFTPSKTNPLFLKEIERHRLDFPRERVQIQEAKKRLPKPFRKIIK